MPKYQFRLQKVMEAKKSAEDRKKQDLASARRVLDREKQLLLHLHSQGEQCRREVLARLSGRLDVAEEVLYRARYSRLMGEIVSQAETVEHSEQHVCHEREELVRYSKERRILERLKEKGLLDYMRAWLRREQKETDEVGRRTFLRKSDRMTG